MMNAIITVGISASGKSSWAREYAKANKAIITNRDDLRFSLTGCSGWGDYKFDKRLEAMITRLQMNMVDEAYALGRDVIIADTNLNPATRKQWEEYCSGGFTVEIKPFPITLEEAWKRDALRANGVGRDVIYRQWQQWLDFIGRKRYVPDTSKPKAILVDVDGTLAEMNGRGPFEWDKVGNDAPIQVVHDMLDGYERAGYTIVVLSGRDGSCYANTRHWLEGHGIFSELIMRAPGDMRKDSIIKEEIFWRDIAPRYNVQAVVDDRPQVVRMYHDLGLKVIAVANQCIEF